jgi:hypothetical protein
VLRAYVDHDNTARPHQALGLKAPLGPSQPSEATATGEIVRRDRLGGLIHEYDRQAAEMRTGSLHGTGRAQRAGRGGGTRTRTRAGGSPSRAPG